MPLSTDCPLRKTEKRHHQPEQVCCTSLGQSPDRPGNHQPSTSRLYIVLWCMVGKAPSHCCQPRGPLSDPMWLPLPQGQSAYSLLDLLPDSMVTLLPPSTTSPAPQALNRALSAIARSSSPTLSPTLSPHQCHIECLSPSSLWYQGSELSTRDTIRQASDTFSPPLAHQGHCEVGIVGQEEAAASCLRSQPHTWPSLPRLFWQI